MQRVASVNSSQKQSQGKGTNNLPVQYTTLIGREKELADLSALLMRPVVRLLTLTGAGGVGKTRLGLQLAAEVVERFIDGLFFVNLAGIRDTSQVLPTIAHTLAIGDAGTMPVLEQLKGYLCGKSCLLLLDNFEQVVRAAPLLIELLVNCPALKLLVTSRTKLHVRLEYEIVVAPLVLPDPGKGISMDAGIEGLSGCAAIQLFFERARAIKPDFEITRANAHTIAEICVQLEGLPLSIELAAARVRLLSPDKLLLRLQHRLDVLTGGARDLPERQQALRSTIQWSYDLLDMGEQQLFRRLAVFAGGCTLELAEAIVPAAGCLETSVLDGLTSLLDNSLLQQREVEGGEPRLAMLETIREYALDCLELSGEAEVTRRAHADYFVALLDESKQGIPQGRDVTWPSQLEQEHDNLRAALDWLLEREEAEKALRLASALRRLWVRYGYVNEGRQWLERALGGGKAAAAVRAKALLVAGELTYMQGAYDRTEALCRESIVLFQAAGDCYGKARNLTLLGCMERSRGDYKAAYPLQEESLALYRKLEDPRGIIDSLILLASILTYQGNYARASTLIEEGLAKARAYGDNDATGEALNVAATIVYLQGNYDCARGLVEESLALHDALKDCRGRAYDLSFLAQILLRSECDHAAAREMIEEALALFKDLGDRRGIAKAYYRSGGVAFDQKDFSRAQASYESCLTMLWEVEDAWLIAASLEKLAQVALVRKYYVWATRLCGSAAVLREAMEVPVPPIERASSASTLAALRAQLGEKTFAVAWAEGRAMAPKQAFAAQKAAPVPAKSVSKLPTAYPLGLTAREVDVLRVVAEGLTDIQVAHKLVLSPRTVSTHLRSIYNKLGINSRAAATRFALENRLV